MWKCFNIHTIYCTAICGIAKRLVNLGNGDIILNKHLIHQALDTLRELIYVLKRNKIRSLDQWLPKEAKTRKLFDLIDRDEIFSETEAAEILYQSHPSDKKFLMLKKNLKDKLLEMALFSDNPDHSSHVLTKFQLKKNLAITEMLLMENVYHNAEKILHKTLIESQKLNLTDIEIEVVRQLCMLNSLKGVPSETKKYNKELKNLIHKLEAEQTTQSMWEMLMSDKKYILQANENLAGKAREYLIEIQKFPKDANSAIVGLYELKIRLFIAKFERKYQKVKEILSETDSLFENYPSLFTHLQQVESLLEKARYFRNINKLKDAEVLINTTLQYADYRAFNKFEVQALYVDVLMKLNRFEEAHHIIKEVAQTSQFELLHSNDKAFWMMMEGYVYIAFSLAGKYDIVPVFTVYTQKNIVQALEMECKSVSKDKIGYNLQFIILKLLLLIVNGGYKLDWDAGFLNVYMQRYVKNSPEKRTIHFLKIFIKVVGIGLTDIENKALKDLYAKIEKNTDYGFDVCEILPYPFIIKTLLEWVKKEDLYLKVQEVG